MDHELHKPPFELVPDVGWGGIRLGSSECEVRQSLIDNELKFDESFDAFGWELEEPWCTLSFANDPIKRLVQISTSSDSVRVFGEPLVGMMLDEALLALGITRFDDTVWSVGEVESDFAGGKPFVDVDHRTKRSPSDLLSAGTLWIKSLGLGLTLYAAEIASVSLREENYLPQNGYGPLDEQTLDAASDPRTRVALLEANARTAAHKSQAKLPLRALLGMVTLITGAVLCWIIYTMASDYRSWLDATPVSGKVIALEPDGPIPDALVVEYRIPPEQLVQAKIPSQYTTAREIGEDVELVFRESNPMVAMTRLQSRDYFSSLSLNWLIYTVPLFTLEILLLFPSLRHRWKK
jgi:hypothetical protein